MEVIRVGLVLIILVSGLVTWWKAGFKCPFYIHVIGVIGTALGFWIAYTLDPETDANKWPLLGKWWIVFIMPAFVYGGFAIYGRGVYSNRK